MVSTAQASREKGHPPPPPPGVQSSALFLAVALLVLGNGLQSTVVAVRGAMEGMPPEIIGLIMSAYFAGFVAGSVWIPRLIREVGHIRTFAALASLASAAALCFVVFAGAVPWLLLRMVTGACFAGMLVVAESWLNAATTPRRRGRVLGLYSLIFYAAWAASQPLLNVAPADGFLLFLLVSIFFSLALVPVTLTRTGVPGVVEATRARLGRLYAISPLGLGGAFALGLAVGAFWGLGPAFGQRAGLTEAQISQFLTLAILGALLLQWPLGWLSDHVDRRLVITGCCAVAAAGAAFLGLAWEAGSTLRYAAVVLIGGFAMPAYSLCVAHVNDHIESGEIVAAASGLILVYGVGSAMGPLAAGLLMGRLGPAGLFLFMATALGGFALYALGRLLATAAPRPDEKESYVSVPQTSHAVLPLHEHSAVLPAGVRRSASETD